MVPGTPPPGTIICARCGWQNEATARMCGGCGTPLRSTDPGATGQAITGAVPGQFAAYSQDAPTALSPGVDYAQNPGVAQAYAHPVTPPAMPQMPTPVAGPALAPAWPGAGPAKAKPTTGKFKWWLIPVILLIVLVVLVVGSLGIYGLGISPSMHNQVETTFPAALNAAFTQVNAGLTPKNEQVQIAATTLEQAISAKSPSSGSITQIHFAYTTTGFALTYTYTFFGSEVQDTATAFSVEDGHLAARQTIVDGSMSLFESGTEMETILNNALSKLTAIQGKVQNFSIAGGVLTLQLTS